MRRSVGSETLSRFPRGRSSSTRTQSEEASVSNALLTRLVEVLERLERGDATEGPAQSREAQRRRERVVERPRFFFD